VEIKNRVDIDSNFDHMFTVYSPSKLTVHTGKWIFSRSSCLDRSMLV
jgi:hypothetical protein